MKVIFLDIDGVLNAHQFSVASKSCSIDQGCVRQFNRVLEATDAKVVISSAWRYMMLRTDDSEPAMTMRGFEYMLRTHGMPRMDIIGHTRSDEYAGRNGHDNQSVRGKLIRLWLAENPGLVDRYVVLDDDADDVLLTMPFIKTNGSVGLTEQDAERAIEMLQETK